MPPASQIAFALIAGFLVFITVRGELPSYLCVIGLGANCATPDTTAGATPQTAGAGGLFDNILKDALKIGPI